MGPVQDESAGGGVAVCGRVGKLEPNLSGAVLGVPNANLFGYRLRQALPGGSVADDADLDQIAAKAYELAKGVTRV